MTTQTGKYEIQAELGRGAFTSVFRAWDPAAGRLVALKALNPEAGKERCAEFRDAAAAAANLHHKNIVTIYEVGEHAGLPFLAMEYVQGEDLAHALANRRPLTLLQKMQIMSQVADALGYAHQTGTVRLDIRPAKIMLLADGSVKILGFGPAEPGYLGADIRLASPEQLAFSGVVDQRADIFAYGVVYYELLTGKHPFEDTDEDRMVARIVNEDPAPVSTLGRECPEALEQIVHRALQKDPELRYQGLEDLQFDAEPILIELKREQAAGFLAELRGCLADKQLEAAQALVRAILELDPGNREARQARDTLQRQVSVPAGRPLADALSQEIGEASASAEQTERNAKLLAEAEREYAKLNFAEARRIVSEVLEIDPQNQQATQLLEAVSIVLEIEQTAGYFAPHQTEDSLEPAGTAEAEQEVRSRPEDEQRAPAAETVGSRAISLAQVQGSDGAIRSAGEGLNSLPESADLQPVLEDTRAAAAAYHRERAVAEAVEQCEQMRLEGHVAKALQLIELSLHTYSGEPRLLELRALLEKEREQHQRDAAVRKAAEEARRLIDQVRPDLAIPLLQQGLASYPGEGELVSLLAAAEQAMPALERRQFVLAVAHRKRRPIPAMLVLLIAALGSAIGWRYSAKLPALTSFSLPAWLEAAPAKPGGVPAPKLDSQSASGPVGRARSRPPAVKSRKNFDTSTLFQPRTSEPRTAASESDLPPPFISGIGEEVRPNLPVPPGGIIVPAMPAPPPPAPEGDIVSERTRPGADFQEPRLLAGPPPRLPPLAKKRGVYGVVQLEVTVTKKGIVKGVTVLSGHPFLVTAAREAVLKRRYQPGMLNGEPVEAKVPIQIAFEPSR